ncbi:TPA: fimbrial protein [Serratia marcescens]
MSKRKFFQTACRTLYSLLFLLCFPLQGADMQIKGALIEPPPCRVNDGGVIDISFGPRVGIKKVNGENYRQKINYTINCEPGVKGWVLVLALVGTAADFDHTALRSDKMSLGIRVLHDKQPFLPGVSMIINAGAPPELEAVPVAEGGVLLSEGEFSASASLLAYYQ